MFCDSVAKEVISFLFILEFIRIESSLVLFGSFQDFSHGCVMFLFSWSCYEDIIHYANDIWFQIIQYLAFVGICIVKYIVKLNGKCLYLPNDMLKVHSRLDWLSSSWCLYPFLSQWCRNLLFCVVSVVAHLRFWCRSLGYIQSVILDVPS